MSPAVVALVLALSLIDPGPDARVQPSADPRVTGEAHRIYGWIFGPEPPPDPHPNPPPAPTPPLQQPGALLGEIRFCLNCAELTQDDADVLAHLAVTIPEGSCVSVEGHADRTGDADDNVTLSLARADVVAEFLYARALEVDPVGFGETVPRHRGDQADRRVEVRYRLVCPHAGSDGPPPARPANP